MTCATACRESWAICRVEADPPEVIKADASADPVMFVSFSSASMSLLDITDYAERNLIDRLSTVPGVARVSIGGARRYAMRIWIDRQALAARQLTVADIEDALRRENVELPAGRLESRTREFSLRTLVGLQTEEDFRNLVIARGEDGHLIRLSEVASVERAAENDRTYTRYNGRVGVSLTVEAQSKANTLDVVHGVRAEIERIQPSLPQGAVLQTAVDNAVAIEAALREVLIAVAFALFAVLAVIYAFLGSLRATMIPAVTIPTSIIASFTVMYALGYSVNVLTLLGLVLAIGLVVDDAVVVLENIHRRAELGEAPLVAAVRGSHEIGFAVIATTMTLAAVFVPISFLPGDLGRLFGEFGFTLAAAVLFSALVALTLTPMMASKLPESETQRNRFAHAVDRLLQARRQRLRPMSAFTHSPTVARDRRGWGAGRSLGGLTFRTVPAEFTPAADLGRAFITIEGPEGATFEYMDGYARRLEATVMKEMEKGDIERVMVRIPGVGGGGDIPTGDVNSARVVLILKDWRQRDRSARESHGGVCWRRRANFPACAPSQGSRAVWVVAMSACPCRRTSAGRTIRRCRAGRTRFWISRGGIRGLRTSTPATRSASRRFACPWIAIGRPNSACRCRL